MDIIGLKFERIPIPVESVDAKYDRVWRAKAKRGREGGRVSEHGWWCNGGDTAGSRNGLGEHARFTRRERFTLSREDHTRLITR